MKYTDFIAVCVCRAELDFKAGSQRWPSALPVSVYGASAGAMTCSSGSGPTASCPTKGRS